MRRVFLLLLLLCLPAPAAAKWASVPLEELVQDSDVIVVGTLRGVYEHTAGGRDYGEGRIEVREVIWGRVAAGDSLRLKWSNSSAVICPRLEHGYNAGQEGIWLLTRDGADFGADHPGRFVRLAARGRVEAVLARSPLVLRAGRHWVGREDAMPFEVVYRNASGAPREFPGVAFDAGRPLFAPGSTLAVRVMRGDASRPLDLAGRYASPGGLAPVTLGPGDELRFELDLRQLMRETPREGESYHVTLRLPGLPPSNELWFYVPDEGFEPAPAAEAGPRPKAAAAEAHAYFAPAAPRGLPPLVRAGLAWLAALLLFPFFYRLRAALTQARPARAADGVQRWLI